MADEIERHNKMVLGELVMGDLVEFPGPIYSHWAVYIGGCEIVHLSGIDRSRTATDLPSSNVFTISGIEYTNACVKRENFLNVASESKVKKNNDNDKDRDKRQFSGEEIKERALSKIGPILYSVLLNNCEHFAVWCRYGKKESKQVKTVVKNATVLAVGGIGVITYKKYTGGNDMKLGPTSNSATNLQILIALGQNQAGFVAPKALVDFGRRFYPVFTGLIDNRSFPGAGIMARALPSLVPPSSHGMLNSIYGIHFPGKFLFDMGCCTGTCVWNSAAYGMNWPK